MHALPLFSIGFFVLLFCLSVSAFNDINYVRAHGSIMMFAWILLGSTGVLIASFFKFFFPQVRAFGRARLWLVIHRPLMSLVVAMTLVGFVVILIDLKFQWIDKNNKISFAHSIIGVLTISLAFFQPLIAMLRCHPEQRGRPIFNVLHSAIGYSVLVLGISAIFLGLIINSVNLDNKGLYIMIAWSAWFLVAFIIFQLLEYSQFQIEESKSETLSNYSIHIKRNKLILLGFHIVISIGVSVALVVILATHT